jgi:acetyltransferase-like isoleucine patch superfamily enzyme
MKTLIVGMGEIGTALNEVLSEEYPTQTYDIKCQSVVIHPVEIMHICFPYTEDFIQAVEKYIDSARPRYTVIHSTIPVGTTEKIKRKGLFHSPVRGKHPNIKKGLLNYIKYISYDVVNLDFPKLDKVRQYFEKVGIVTKVYPDFRVTELMKLLALARYGVYIAFAKEQERLCNTFGLQYHDVVNEYEETRNEGLSRVGTSFLSQPILYPFNDFVGGHCVVENMGLLLSQVETKPSEVETPLLREALKIAKGTVIHSNCNVYSTARIGKGCSIGQFCEIGHNVVIGNNVRIGAFTFIPEGVTIEDDCFIAPKVTFSNDKYPPAGREKWGKVIVKKGAVVGMGSIILPGVEIGEKALIGAGSIITKSVPAGEKWYGQAAHAHGKREE